jgi:SAM-dependent methyltransferase
MSLGRFRALARNWEALGDTDPLFGVLSDPTKHGGKWEIDAFFESGRAHVAKLLRTLDDARAGYERGKCLDFGCGVGRLTLPLSESFAWTVGVDVARPMIEVARSHLRPDSRCEFVVNRKPDLGRFPDAAFDVVHSCLVLQHMPPEISLRYIREFFRVCRPGGLVVFQLPAETRSEEMLSATHALAQDAYAAGLAVQRPPAVLEPSALSTLLVRLTNRSPVPWPHDIPAGRHISVGNHWLRHDGTIAVHDDGRTLLPCTVDPGGSIEVALTVQAPSEPGKYVLEVDLVQEHVCWFADKGSATARVPIGVSGTPAGNGSSAVTGPSAESMPPLPYPVARRGSLLRRVLQRLRGDTPTFEMHVVPRGVVEETIRAAGGRLLRAVDDNAAGPRWLSYTYICRS